MALLERVSTLIRANLNDLIDRAEDPEKMIKQVILDMRNQLMQVKTQVAIAIADQHVLEKKQRENAEKEAEWMRKAELAVDKKQDDLARAALERSMSYKQMTGSFDSLVADQKTEVDNLKSALHKLEQKLAEAESKSDALIAQHRRSRALSKASDAQLAISDKSKVATFERMKSKVRHAEAVSKAKAEMANDNIEDKLAALEKQDEIEKLLKEIKARRAGEDCEEDLPLRLADGSVSRRRLCRLVFRRAVRTGNTQISQEARDPVGRSAEDRRRGESLRLSGGRIRAQLRTGTGANLNSAARDKPCDADGPY